MVMITLDYFPDPENSEEDDLKRTKKPLHGTTVKIK
jgi:hypothetical protein